MYMCVRYPMTEGSREASWALKPSSWEASRDVMITLHVHPNTILSLSSNQSFESLCQGEEMKPCYSLSIGNPRLTDVFSSKTVSVNHRRPSPDPSTYFHPLWGAHTVLPKGLQLPTGYYLTPPQSCIAFLVKKETELTALPAKLAVKDAELVAFRLIYSMCFSASPFWNRLHGIILVCRAGRFSLDTSNAFLFFSILKLVVCDSMVLLLNNVVLTSQLLYSIGD